ncbi:hypothetical protein EV653_2297 [Kribbella pratensis]|uniref:Uncharacterized protein n=1 Tax=Kribbella pratensis TaxID=2512112 RepID=A0A4R8CM70_9ACTN|nr:hypothetical protein EV653_2297 [Kribbella pratensis]
MALTYQLQPEDSAHATLRHATSGGTLGLGAGSSRSLGAPAEPEPQMVRRDAFSVAGWGMGVSAVSGGFARAMWINSFSQMLPASAGISRDFRRQVSAEPLDTAVRTITSADAHLSFGRGYGSALQPQTPSTAAKGRAESTGEQLKKVLLAKPPDRSGTAQAVGMANAMGVPLNGLDPAPDRAGWHYLIDLWDLLHTRVEQQELQTMPEPTAAWLLARRQEIAELRETTAARSPTGLPLGGPGARTGDVEHSTGTAVARYLQGERQPSTSPRIAADLAAVAGLRNLAGVSKTSPAPSPVDEAITRLETYLHAYFAQPLRADQRIATVLVISNADWGTGGSVMAALTPQGIASMVLEIGKQIVLMQGLLALGPVGEVLAAGYQGFMQTEGVNDITAAITLGEFFREAATADSFDRARGLGWFAKVTEDDVVQLMQAAVGFVLERGVKVIGEQVIRTARDASGPAVRMSVSSEQSQEAMLATLQRQLLTLPENHPDRPSLIALRDALTTAKTAGADPDRALTGDPAVADKFALVDVLWPHTDSEMAAMREQIPPELADRVPVVQAILPEGVVARVVYDAMQVRIEVSSRAGPADVRHHVETARYLSEYVGIRGFFRRVLDRLVGDPAFMSKGFEARAEIAKLRAIEAEVSAEMAALQRSGADPAAHQARLADLRAQIDEYQDAVNSLDRGRGWIAAGTGVGNQTARRAGLPMTPGHHYRVNASTGQLYLVRHDKNAPGHYQLAKLTLGGKTFDWPIDRRTKLPYLHEVIQRTNHEKVALSFFEYHQQRIEGAAAGKIPTKDGEWSEYVLASGGRPALLALGVDPAPALFRGPEFNTALLVMKEKNVTLTRLPAATELDWADQDGKTYDAVGSGIPARFFDQQWPRLQLQIDEHLKYADFVPVDVSTLTPAQRLEVEKFVAPRKPRAFIVSDN